jgi:hypothetical protein
MVHEHGARKLLIQYDSERIFSNDWYRPKFLRTILVPIAESCDSVHPRVAPAAVLSHH